MKLFHACVTCRCKRKENYCSNGYYFLFGLDCSLILLKFLIQCAVSFRQKLKSKSVVESGSAMSPWCSSHAWLSRGSGQHATIGYPWRDHTRIVTLACVGACGLCHYRLPGRSAEFHPAVQRRPFVCLFSLFFKQSYYCLVDGGDSICECGRKEALKRLQVRPTTTNDQSWY